MTDMEKDRNQKYTVITDKRVTVCGRVLEHEHTGSAMLTEIYRAQLGDWPKFFKMDTLSKVGYLASELLLKELGEHRLEGEEYTSDRAIALFGTTASLCADRNYQKTIQDIDNYYPSPAIFVYTLPNIVTGEIAIRNHYRGETSFYVMDGLKQEAPKIDDLPFKGDTIVGNDCWIGQNVTILPGVHIGNGVIIGANSVVTKDLPSYSICCGNPCVIKKMRFSDDVIKLLEDLKWWDKSVEEIQKIIPIITKASPTKDELIKLL